MYTLIVNEEFGEHRTLPLTKVFSHPLKYFGKKYWHCFTFTGGRTLSIYPRRILARLTIWQSRYDIAKLKNMRISFAYASSEQHRSSPPWDSSQPCAMVTTEALNTMLKYMYIINILLTDTFGGKYKNLKIYLNDLCCWVISEKNKTIF